MLLPKVGHANRATLENECFNDLLPTDPQYIQEVYLNMKSRNKSIQSIPYSSQVSYYNL